MALDQYYTLGRSGLRVSRLALGTMTFGDDWGWGATGRPAWRCGRGRQAARLCIDGVDGGCAGHGLHVRFDRGDGTMTACYGAPITLEQAGAVMAAAEAEATACGWPMVIAIVGSGGHLVMLHALDQAQHASVAVAQAKAETAVNFRRPSKLFEDAVASGSLGLRLLGMSNLMPLDGGLPLLIDGCVVGAIGVSGMQSAQDAQVAAAGVAALVAAASGSH